MKKIFFVAVLILLAGCLPLNTAPQQAETPGIVETVVAATYAAITTQTAKAMPPTATITPTSTRTPTKTPLPPTATPTFIYLLFTATPTASATPPPTETGTGAVGIASPYACQLIRQSPEITATFSPNERFEWRWTVENVGQRVWPWDNMTYKYIRGSKLHEKDVYQLGNNIEVGERTQFSIPLRAPKEPGSYFTTWAMRKGKYIFCYATVQVIVH